MEYFLGSLTTIIAIVVFFKFVKNKISLQQPKKINYSQSYMHNLLKPFLPTNGQLERINPKKTQSRLHKKSKYVKILFMDSKAYWIKNNVFYSADIVDGQILEESTQKVDTMAMNKVELDKMIFIVEKLTEGFRNDNSNSGF